MALQVREMSERGDKTFSAWVICNPKGQHVATVQACWTKNGMCYVDVWNSSLSKTQTDGPQQGKASGYGYDKFAAALRNMMIDGHKMFDHCGQDEKSEKLLAQYKSEFSKLGSPTREAVKDFDAKWRAKVEKFGMRFANYHQEGEHYRYSSLYYDQGFSRLGMMGYEIIQAL